MILNPRSGSLVYFPNGVVATPRSCEDRALVLRAVEQQGFALQFAAKALQKDHEALQSVVGWSGFRSRLYRRCFFGGDVFVS